MFSPTPSPLAPLPSAQPFEITPETTIFSPYRNHPCGLVVAYDAYENIQAKFVSPVNVLLFLRIVNLQPVPTLIDSIVVEMPTSTGRWMTPIRLDARKVRLFGINGKEKRLSRALATAHAVDTNFLDVELAEQQLISHGTARGALMFAYPRPMPTDETALPVFRITVTDVAGVHEQVTKNALLKDDTILLQMLKMDGKADLSKRIVRHYDDPITIKVRP